MRADWGWLWAGCQVWAGPILVGAGCGGSDGLALPSPEGPSDIGQAPHTRPHPPTVAGRQVVPEKAEAEAQMPSPHKQPSLLAGIGASGGIVMKAKSVEKR